MFFFKGRLIIGLLSLALFSLAHAAPEAPEPETPSIVCFGDSITKRGYSQALSQLVGAGVVNSGIAGHNSRQGLRRIKSDVLAYQPDFVVILFGTNDIRVDSKRAHVTLKDYRENLLKIIEHCSKIDAQPILCTLPPIREDVYFKRHEQKPYDEAGGLKKLLSSYCSAVTEIAAAKQIPLVDLNTFLVNEPTWCHPDGVHPSPDGNAIIAKYIAQSLRPLLPSPKTQPTSENNTHQADIVIYGATSAGITAAVQARRMGKSVLLVEPSNHLGGLTSGGLGATDIGNKNVVGGLSRKFYQQVARHYQKEESWTHETRKNFFTNKSKRTKENEIFGPEGTMWTFEPKVASAIFEQLLSTWSIPTFKNEGLKEVRKEGTKIISIQTESKHSYKGKMFIDATYEGDLMAMTGVSYHVGREGNAIYQETLNGVRDKTPKNQLFGNIDPYNTPGDPSSGLLPLIQEGEGGTHGKGDHRVQAYNFRLCFTHIAKNRLPLEPPANYDPDRYEIAARCVEQILEAGEKPHIKHFCNPVWMPNGKTDINNSQGISTDFIGANYDYPEGNSKTRAEIRQAHEDYIRGFWHFMSHSPRIPEYLKEEFLALGPCRDEFTATEGWSAQLYVREARRMISDYVMTEHNCRSKKTARDSIGMAAYQMDSHNCQRIVKNGIARNEGDVQAHGFKPYPISYRSIIPKAEECENLSVPVCISASHIAFGSIRMEPIFMVLGESAATAACLAINKESTLQELAYSDLRAVLLASGQVLELRK